MHVAHLARAENELLASLLEDKLRFVFRKHMRGAVVLFRQLFLSLHHFAGEANDHVVLIGLSVDRDGTECGASDLHGLILVPKCQCPSRKISYSHFESRSMRDSDAYLRQFDNLVHALDAVIHRDLKDRMLFLDPQSRFFRSFIARIRGFLLPIHLEVKSAAVHPFALRDWLRDGFSRHGWHSYGLARLSRRRCHLMISLGRCDIKTLLQATNDVTQRALTRCRREADSEVGVIFKAGHPCYFVGFLPEPMPGQTIEDVARAEAIFLEKVISLHPDAEGK